MNDTPTPQSGGTPAPSPPRVKQRFTPVLGFTIISCAVLGVVIGGAEWLFQRHLTWFASANMVRLLVAGPFLLGLMPLVTQSVNWRWLRYISTARSKLGFGIRFLLRLFGLPLLVTGWFAFVMILLRPLELQNIVLDESPLDTLSTNALAMTPLLAGLSAIAIYLGTIFMNGAHRARVAESYREPTDGQIRNQIVYFRSFAADVNPGSKSGYFSSFSFVSEEEMMASSFEKEGRRVFAIGRPGESLPLLGARRIYCSDDTWQARVLSMIEAASLVVIRPESTQFVLWEISQIAAKVAPNRILIWAPPSAGETVLYEADEKGEIQPVSHWMQFCDNADSLFHGQLAPLRNLQIPITDARFVGFNENWSAFVFPDPKETDDKKRNRLLMQSILSHASR